MKKATVFLIIVVLGTLNSIGQENYCTDAELYNIVFEKLKLYERKAVDIQIGYKPSKFIINSIDEMNIFNEAEMNQFNNLPSDIDYLSCTKLNDQIQSILSDDLIKENGSYNTRKFTNVITLSDFKKVILTYKVSRNKKYKGGKATGGEMIYTLIKKEGEWILEDRKLIAMY